MNTLTTFAAAFLYVNHAASVTNRVTSLPASAPRLANPAVRVVNLAAAAPAVRAACGYYTLLNDEPPAAPTATNYYERTGYALNAAATPPTYSTIWEERAVTPPATKYSKLKLYAAISSLGAWDALKTWLEAKTLNGVNGWTAFLLAQEISDDHPLFEALYAEALTTLNLTREQGDALLSQCKLED